MTKEELQKKIIEATGGWEWESDAGTSEEFKAGVEFGMKLEREAAQELIKILEWMSSLKVEYGIPLTPGGDEINCVSVAKKALTRWRESVVEE